MDDEEKYLFLPTIPQRTVPVWIPTCDDDDDDDDDYDDDDDDDDDDGDFKDHEKLPHPHINTLVTVRIKIFYRPENRRLLIREIL